MAVINGTPGDDVLTGTDQDDTIAGFAGNARITGGGGNDTALFNGSTDGADRTDLGDGSDLVRVTSNTAGQIRIGLAPLDVGNGTPFAPSVLNDRTSMFLGTYVPLLPVPVQAEGADDTVVGPVSRFDDEGVTFISETPGITFDVRESIRSPSQGFVEGRRFGDQFTGIILGSQRNDVISAAQAMRSHYITQGSWECGVTEGGDRRRSRRPPPKTMPATSRVACLS